MSKESWEDAQTISADGSIAREEKERRDGAVKVRKFL
jgi:hypothetical protein